MATDSSPLGTGSVREMGATAERREQRRLPSSKAPGKR